MPLSTDGQNSAATGVATDFTYLALFDGDPAGAGTEVSGGSPAYARQEVTFGSASSGQIAGTGSPVVTFDVPAGDVTHWALYSAVTAGTLGASGALGATETFGAQGEFEASTFVLDPEAS